MAIQRKWYIQSSFRACANSNQIRPSCGSCGLEDDLAATYPYRLSNFHYFAFSTFCYHVPSAPYRYGLPDLGQTIKRCGQCCMATPNPVSRISHLHCAFQKTCADPGLGMNTTQTNPISFHLHQSTSGSRSRSPFDRTRLQIFLRDLLAVVHSFPCSIYNTRLPHSSIASYHNRRHSK
jgi:hypothetical protein